MKLKLDKNFKHQNEIETSITFFITFHKPVKSGIKKIEIYLYFSEFGELRRRKGKECE